VQKHGKVAAACAKLERRSCRPAPCSKTGVMAASAARWVRSAACWSSRRGQARVPGHEVQATTAHGASWAGFVELFASLRVAAAGARCSRAVPSRHRERAVDRGRHQRAEATT